MFTNVLITSSPGTGKTTLIIRVVERLRKLGFKAGGFYTEEIRERGRRLGFKVTSLDGHQGVLADVKGIDGPKVGRYRVRLREFEAIGVKALEGAVEYSDIIIVDEIGKMELFSEAFRDALKQALNSSKPLIGTIGRIDNPLVSQIKRRPDVRLISLSKNNRDELVNVVVHLVAGFQK